MRHEAEMKAILKQVELLTQEEKRWLSDKLREEALSEPGGAPITQKRPSFGELLGVANPTGRDYTDDEVDQLRYEALNQKHLL
jgi:hypothetical protein